MSEFPESTGEQAGTDPAVDQSGGEPEPESYHGYSVDDEDQPQSYGDSLVDDRGLTEPLDEGYSPPEKWSPGEGFGNTPYEEAVGETLDQRYAQEVPEEDPYEAAEHMSVESIENDGDGGEVGDRRSGRLVAPDEGAHEDVESDEVAEDVGIDGAGASAEEAAVHTIEE
jgi:hypothetical protein